MNQILDALQYGFVQRALVAGCFVAVSCAFLGLFLVLRRFSMIGDGLSHFAFATIGLALFLNVYPLYIAVPLTVLASLFILYLSERANVYGDAAIGMISSIGVALGIILASMGDGFNVDLFSYLFGDILTISKLEAVTSVILSIFVMSLISLFYHDLFAITFDEEYALVLGINSRRINKVLIILTSVTVVLGIKVVGTMLVSSLIIFPSISALQIARGFKSAIGLSFLITVLSVIVGILLAFTLDIPAGAAIVMLNFFLFIVSFIVGSWVKGR